MTNGDSISGEVLKIEKDKLSIQTAYAGAVTIDWRQVSSLETEQEFEVEAENGWRSIGEVVKSGERFYVRSDQETHSFSASRVTKLAPLEKPEQKRGFWRTWDGNADFGLNFARGNTRLNQGTVTVAALYRAKEFQFKADILSMFSRQQAAPTADRHLGAFRLDKYLGPETFVYTLAVLENDARRLLNYRSSFGGGLGWKVRKSPDQEVSILGGVSVVTERYQTSATAEPLVRTGEGLLGFDLRKNLEGGVQFTTRMQVTPNLIDLGRYRVSLESG
ncbi:MAG TPA: DUF481 domain-containing protein, partial [Bryobacteraceae bacterium]|nr:DUF481 domain-containing protein [Bryobacteraceae bacterium]